jgi:hypothetical protein
VSKKELAPQTQSDNPIAKYRCCSRGSTKALSMRFFLKAALQKPLGNVFFAPLHLAILFLAGSVPFSMAQTFGGSPRVVKKLGPPVTAARLMVWKPEWAAISADAETAQFQARASAGQDVRRLGQ